MLTALRARPRARILTFALAALAALALTGALASTASADVRLVRVTGTQTYPLGTFAFSGTALIVTTQPGPPPITPANAVRVTTALGALGTDAATGTSCAAAGLQSTVVSADSPARLATSNRIVPGNPVTPDPVCNELGTLTVTYRLTLAPDGTITTATATAGPPSVDLPPTLG